MSTPNRMRHQVTTRPLTDADRAAVENARHLARVTGFHDLRRLAELGTDAAPHVVYANALGVAQRQLDALADVLARVTGEQL